MAGRGCDLDHHRPGADPLVTTRLVLFDIDGTLLWTDGAGRRAIHRALIEVFGATGPADHRFDGKTDPQIVRELMRDVGHDDAHIDARLQGLFIRYVQCLREELRDGVWTVSAGNAAQGVAFAARKIGARCSVMVMDTAPDTKIRAIERLGAAIVRASYDECWRTVESSARMDRIMSCAPSCRPSRNAGRARASA